MDKQTKLKALWSGMKTRCSNRNRVDYMRYGGRGINVSKEWLIFNNFWKDMQDTYKSGYTLERIDNNKGYSKENCYWATRKEQANNTRSIDKARKYTFNNMTKTIRQWAELMGIKRTTLDMRLRHYNWPIEKALGGIL